MSALFKVHNLCHHYHLGGLEVPALRGIDLEIEAGGMVCIMGPSGSGKSTLLSVLGLIEPASAGSLSFAGEDMSTLSTSRKNFLRRYQFGFVFQEFHLMQVLTAFENIEFFLARQKIDRLSRRERVLWALEQVGLADQRDKLPGQMSGGQRQRVAIARALAKNPKVIFADEPTASLDQTTGRAIVELLAGVSATHQATVIMASHDAMASTYAQRRIRIVDGRLTQET
jgi:putative ABC transport system ATP-binding protein